MKLHQTDTAPIAAARSGFSSSSAYRIEKDRRLPLQRQVRRERRRPDPLADVWQSEIVPILEAAPGLRPAFSRRFCGAIPSSARVCAGPWSVGSAPGAPSTARTRRSSFAKSTNRGVWSVRLHRDERSHRHHRGRVARPPSLPLPPGLFRLRTCPRHPERRNYVALAEGLQNALWALGGAPLEHRSDSLSAAFRNLGRDTQDDLTRRYHELCAHYGMTPGVNPSAANVHDTRLFPHLLRLAQVGCAAIGRLYADAG